MRPDRDAEIERAGWFSDLLADDPGLRRVVSDLDALYNQPHLPIRLLLPREWATDKQATGAQSEPRSVQGIGALSGASRISMTGATMSLQKKPTRPRRIQVLAATAAALAIVGLLSYLLTRGAPAKQPPAGSTQASGDAIFLQRFAEQGGVSVVLNYSCPPDASQCNAEALLPQLEAALDKRLAATTGVTGTFFQPRGGGTLAVKVLGVKDDQGIAALLGSIGQLNIVDTGSQQVPVGQTVTVCSASAQVCPAGSYHVVFRGQQTDPNSVSAQLDQQTNQPIVSFEFDSATRAAFATYTRDHVGQYLTITLDNQVIESATIQSEIDGVGQITGLPTVADAQRLAADLKNGALPLDVAIESHQTEGPISCSPSNNSGQPLGVPAITPRIAHPASGQPAYTAADARAYIEAHMPGVHASILQIYQVTALQAAALEDDECTGLPNNTPIFYVTFTGDFEPPSAPGSQSPANVLHFAGETFDGVTGNLIMTTNLTK